MELDRGNLAVLVPGNPVEAAQDTPVEAVPGTLAEAVRNYPAEEAAHTLAEAHRSLEQEVVRSPEVDAEPVGRKERVVHKARQEEHLPAPGVDPWCWRWKLCSCSELLEHLGVRLLWPIEKHRRRPCCALTTRLDDPERSIQELRIARRICRSGVDGSTR